MGGQVKALIEPKKEKLNPELKVVYYPSGEEVERASSKYKYFYDYYAYDESDVKIVCNSDGVIRHVGGSPYQIINGDMVIDLGAEDMSEISVDETDNYYSAFIRVETYSY